MKSTTRDAPLAPIKEGRPVKIFTDNSVETIVFGSTYIPHPCNHTVPHRCEEGSSSVYIYKSVNDTLSRLFSKILQKRL